MNSKSLFFKVFVGFCVSSCLIGCNINKKEKSDEQKEETQPTDTTNYDDGYVDGYLKGYDEGKVSGYTDGFADGKAEGFEDGYDQGKDDGKKEQEEIDRNYKSIHTNLQLQYLNNNDYSVLPTGVNGTEELSRPEPLRFEVQESPLYSASDITSSKLRISETNDFTNPANYIEVTGDAENHFEVYNLKINTKYYYYYWAETATATYYSDIKEVFVKNEAPRSLFIDGVTNARDDGGWKIKGQNKYTKQGLMYRMGRLNTSGTTYIQPAGIASFQALGIKTEIDLRNSSDYLPSGTAVEGVAYYNFPLSHTSNASYFTDDTNKLGVKNTLKLMANSSNYPLMFHCNIGTDRTGFISFIVNALLGVEEECLYRDYMMSNFTEIGSARDIASISTYLSQLKTNYNGASDLSLGAKNYMLSLGVSEENIESIKTIMLGA